MARALRALLPAAVLLVSAPLAGAGRLQTSPLSPRRAWSTNLLEKGKKKWNWKTASEETKTEWGIVLKRYVMFDMNLLQLEHLWDEALPSEAVGTSGGDSKVDDESLARIKAKVAKLQDNLEKAVLDQNTSDTTADDMQRDIRSNYLTKAEKTKLREGHQRERYGFFSVEASAQDVFSQASSLLQAISAQSSKPAQSWASIVPAPTAYPSLLTNATELRAAAAIVRGSANSTQNSTAGSKGGGGDAPETLSALLAKYHEVVKTFRTDLGNFQNMQKKAW